MTGAAAGLCLQPTLNPSCRTNYAEFLPDGIKFMIELALTLRDQKFADLGPTPPKWTARS